MPGHLHPHRSRILDLSCNRWWVMLSLSQLATVLLKRPRQTRCLDLTEFPRSNAAHGGVLYWWPYFLPPSYLVLISTSHTSLCALFRPLVGWPSHRTALAACDLASWHSLAHRYRSAPLHFIHHFGVVWKAQANGLERDYRSSSKMAHNIDGEYPSHD